MKIDISDLVWAVKVVGICLSAEIGLAAVMVCVYLRFAADKIARSIRDSSIERIHVKFETDENI